MPNINQSLHDAAVRHQIFLQRYGGSTANNAIKILDEAQRDLEERLRKRLARLGPLDRQAFGRGLATTKRMQALLDEVKLQNRDLRVALGKQLKGDLKDLADLEVDIASRRLTEAMGVDLNNLRPSPEVLRSLSQMSTSRLRGRTLGQWFKKFEADRFTRVESAVRLGMVEGDTITQIARRIRQAGEASKIAANALARTSVNHVANSAREAFYEANSDIISKVRWTATLDGRTSAICQARDGLTWPVDEPHPRPPAHPNCRSVLTPVTKSWEELTGGEVRLDPKRMKGPGFEKAMRKDLAERGMTQGQIDDFIAAQKRQLTGKVARTDTYQNWLTDQPAAFQDSVLGPTRGKLFREGNLSLDKFVDMRSGKPFNLDQLKKMEAKAFSKALVAPAPAPAPAPHITKEAEDAWEARGSIEWEGASARERIPSPILTSSADEEAIRLLKNADVHVRVSPGTLDDIIKDGRFKNQYEVGSSSGEFNPSKRKEFEDFIFGSTSDEKRPIYGYLSENSWGSAKVAPSTTGVQGTVLDQYGGIRVKLKSKVRSRSTFTTGDSLDDLSFDILGTQNKTMSYKPVPLNNPNHTAFNSHDFKKMKSSKTIDDFIGSGDYSEVQIHGGIDIGDIDSILVQDESLFDIFSKNEILQERGIKIKFDPFNLPKG